MKKIAKQLTDLVGNTPLMELSNYNKSKGLKARLIVKLESFNPAGSVKDRVALAMIEDAETSGLLKPGATIIEPTSALAYHSGTPLGLISQSLGHSSIRVTMSYLKPFDAEVIDKVNRQVIALVKGSKKKKVDSINMLYGTLLR